MFVWVGIKAGGGEARKLKNFSKINKRGGGVRATIRSVLESRPFHHRSNGEFDSNLLRVCLMRTSQPDCER